VESPYKVLSLKLFPHPLCCFCGPSPNTTVLIPSSVLVKFIFPYINFKLGLHPAKVLFNNISICYLTFLFVTCSNVQEQHVHLMASFISFPIKKLQTGTSPCYEVLLKNISIYVTLPFYLLPAANV
jgi:hypothetical protein